MCEKIINQPIMKLVQKFIQSKEQKNTLLLKIKVIKKQLLKKVTKGG